MTPERKAERWTWLWRHFMTLLCAGAFAGVCRLVVWGYDDHQDIQKNKEDIKGLKSYQKEANMNFRMLKNNCTCDLPFIYPSDK